MHTYRLIRPLPLVYLAVAAAVGLTATAQAADAPSVKVSYKDLNLGTVTGATTLYHRIQSAAHTVCGEAGRGMEEIRHWRSCYQSAVSRGVSDVHSPILSTLDANGNPRGMQSAQLRK